MRQLIAIFGCLLFAGCATNVEIHGHRGTRGLMPENTLPAFAHALSLGVDVLELDTGITKDGVVVIGHAPCLNADFVRSPDGKWLEPAKKGPCIAHLTFNELQQYDVGRIRPDSVHAKLFSEQRAIDGTRMPTLAALFEMVRKSGNTQVRFNIETKLSPLQADETISPEAFVDALLGVIEREKMLHRVIIHSFDWRTLKLIQQKYPMVPTVYISVQQKFADNIAAIGNNASPWTAGLNINNFGGSVPKMVKYAGGAYWSVYFGDVNQAKISEAQALGLRALVWTVNEPQDIERMLDLKVDGIITDYPNRVREAMGKRGMRLPVSTTMR